LADDFKTTEGKEYKNATVFCVEPDGIEAHGKGRWAVKTDSSLAPTDASAIKAVTPSDMFSCPGPEVQNPEILLASV
jgi:hypothetical protein